MTRPPRVFEIGRGFAVVPFYDGSAIDPGDRTPILLGPGRAFGSGEHVTTASCLEFLEDIPGGRRKTALDLGCGTGILAIAAVKLGTRRVTAVDVEPDAVEATVRNLRLNGVEGGVRAVVGDCAAVSRGRFDLVMANIYGDVLLALRRELPLLLAPGGRLLLSGIRFEDAYDVKREFATGGRVLAKGRYRDEYCTFLFEAGS